jgi:hypothetical protein
MEIYRVKKKMSFSLMIGIILFDLSIAFFLYLFIFERHSISSDYSFLTTGLGYVLLLAFLVFALCFFFAGTYFFFTAKDPLIIRDDGFIDQSSFLGFGFISWNDVLSIYSDYVLTEKYIMVELLDSQKYINPLSSLKKWLLKVNKKLGYSTIQIVFTATKDNIDNVCSIMLEQWNKYKEENHERI